MTGKDELFSEAEAFIKNYLTGRREIEPVYRKMHQFLHDQHLLRTAVADFEESHPAKEQILNYSKSLLDHHGVLEHRLIFSLCQGNTLAIAKERLINAFGCAETAA